MGRGPLPETDPHADRHIVLTSELIARCLSGETEAEQDLFRKQREILLKRATSHRYMPGARAYATPEDVVDEVILRALGSGLLEDLEDRGRGSLSNALSTILDRVLVDIYRRHGARKRPGRLALGKGRSEDPDNSEESDQLPSPEPTPTSNVRAKELIELCKHCLDAREWEVWSMTEIEGLTSPAISLKTGLSDAAVRGVLHRARKKLLSALVSKLE